MSQSIKWGYVNTPIHSQFLALFVPLKEAHAEAANQFAPVSKIYGNLEALTMNYINVN